MTDFDEILAILSKQKRFRHLRQKTGTRLIGDVPHVAPLAYLHEIFTGLKKDEISRLKREVQVEIPGVFVDFLKQANGMALFAGNFNIYGFREYVSRDPEDRQPFCIVTANTIERPKDAKESYFFIGSYREDGSRVYIDNETLNIFHCARRSSIPLNKWWDFWDMMHAEVERLDTNFDDQGKIIDPNKILPLSKLVK